MLHSQIQSHSKPSWQKHSLAAVVPERLVLCPREHEKHAVRWKWGWYLPGSHRTVHEVCPASGWYSPVLLASHIRHALMLLLAHTCWAGRDRIGYRSLPCPGHTLRRGSWLVPGATMRTRCCRAPHGIWSDGSWRIPLPRTVRRRTPRLSMLWW